MASVRLESFVGGSLFDIMIFVSGPVFTTSPHIQSTLRSVQPRRKTESASTGALSFASPRGPSASSVSMPVNLEILSFGCSHSMNPSTRARSSGARARARAASIALRCFRLVSPSSDLVSI